MEDGLGWRIGQWALPVLSLGVMPDALWPPRPTSSLDALKNCKTLGGFSRRNGLPAPFVDLGLPQQRWHVSEALRQRTYTVVRGPASIGKSSLVMRSLCDAILLGHRVKYVELIRSDSEAPDFLDVLTAVVQADNSRGISIIRDSLDLNKFAEFVALSSAARPPHSPKKPLVDTEIASVCAAFEHGLRASASSERPLTIVLDQFSIGAKTFAPSEFSFNLVERLWLPIERASVPDLRVMFVVRDSQYQDYGLDKLNAEILDIAPYLDAQFQKVFFELCRFHRKAKKNDEEVPLDPIAALVEKLALPTTSGYTDVFELITKLMQRLELP